MPQIGGCPDCFDTLEPSAITATAIKSWVDLLISDIDITDASATTADPCAAVAATVRVYDTTGPAEACILVTVKNVGSKSAGKFSLDLFLDPTKAPVVGDVSSRYTVISSLAGNATLTVLFSGVPFPEDWIDLVVDTEQKVSEYRESNNLRSLTDT